MAIILKAGLPPFPGVLQPLGKAAVLLVLRHMDEQLDDGRVVADLFGLEGVDLVIGAPPFGFAATALHPFRSEELPSELQSLMRISYPVFCLKKKQHHHRKQTNTQHMTNKTTFHP